MYTGVVLTCWMLIGARMSDGVDGPGELVRLLQHRSKEGKGKLTSLGRLFWKAARPVLDP